MHTDDGFWLIIPNSSPLLAGVAPLRNVGALATAAANAAADAQDKQAGAPHVKTMHWLESYSFPL